MLVDGSPVPLCHIRVASGVYDEVGLFVDPTSNPLVFTDVPATADGLLQTYCYPTLYPGCVAAWSATWPGGSYGGVVPEDGSPFGPLTVTEGGTTEVLIEVTCDSGVPSGSSPPPPPGSPPAACCPPVPWCLDGGGWDLFPVGDRPAGVTGRPLRSEAIAERDCPPLPPLLLECLGGEFDIEVPAVVYVTLTDATGDMVGLFPDNSVGAAMSKVPDAPFAIGVATFTDVNGIEWLFSVLVVCSYDFCDAAKYAVLVGFTPTMRVGAPPYLCPSNAFTSTAGSGWSKTGSGEINWHRCTERADPVTTGAGEAVATLVAACASLNGSIRVNIST